MTNDEWRAFQQNLKEKLGFGIDVNMTNSVIEALRSFAKTTNEIRQMIDWNALRRSLQTVLDILSSIPADVKKTEFFQKVSELDKTDITYEDIEWFIEDIRDQVLIEEADENVLTNLSKYVMQIKENSGYGVREKITILLSHVEPLMYETMNYVKAPKDNLRKKVKDITVTNNKGMSAKSLAKVYVYGIHSIIFAGTDFFSNPIDKRIPFRNNILHNGIVGYSDEELEIVYEILIDFIDALVVLKYWITTEGYDKTQ